MCRCDERLKAKAEGATRLPYTRLRGGLERGIPRFFSLGHFDAALCREMRGKEKKWKVSFSPFSRLKKKEKVCKEVKVCLQKVCVCVVFCFSYTIFRFIPEYGEGGETVGEGWMYVCVLYELSHCV